MRDSGLYILTSRGRNEVKHLLELDHPLAKRVQAFYYRGNMDFYKPDPRAFEHIEKQHGWKPSECVYVGDSPSDAAAAKGAGLHFIASLESGLRPKRDFKAYRVDAFIYTFSELLTSVNRLDVKH